MPSPPAPQPPADDVDADVRAVVRSLRRGAWVAAVVIALGMPALQAWFGGRSATHLLEAETDRLADRLSQSAAVAPELWLFRDNDIRILLGDSVRGGGLDAAQVVGDDRQVRSRLGPFDDRLSFADQATVYDSGVPLATLHTRKSALPLIGAVAATAAVSLSFAAAVFLLVTRLGVRGIESTLHRLQAARDEALRAGEARKTFLATMSHEIRTPMNGVIGMTSLLRETGLTDAQRRYVEVIRGSGETLLRVINEILEFSKVESGRIVLEPQVFAPATLAEEVLVLLEPLSRHKELKLSLQADAGLPAWVCADASRLRQVLVNLVGNAIKFTRDGAVQLGVSAPAPGRLAFVVRDEGIGMSEAQLASAFDPFVQGDASTSRRFGGTGLGLAISRRIVEAMDGTLEASSTPGRGSTFRVDVPAPAAEAPAGAAVDPSVAVLRGKRVLLVDDRPVNVEIAAALLRGWGVEPVAETDPDAALRRVVAGESFDAAILDYNMPGLDGHALGRRLRGLRPQLPLVLLSSKNGAIHDPGLFDVRLNKPVLGALLRDALRSVLTGTPQREPDMLSRSAVAGVREAIGAPSIAALRVLVAEDNGVNAMVIGSMLERLDVSFDTVGNGLEAIEALARQPYDVVLMDMQMPELDGLEATRRLRADRSLRQPRVVALTANVMADDRELCRAAGMDDFLAKPIQLHELERCLAEAARLREARGG